MVLQAALAALLTRLGSGHDIPIGSPIAGRTDSALDDLVGFFVNTLVLRTDTSGNPSFRELVARVRTGNLAAYSHQELPFERLVEVINPARSLSRHPLFQVMLALQNDAELGLKLAGLTTAFEPIASASAKFDLSVSLAERRGADGAPAGIAGSLEYATDLFDRRTVEALAGRLVRLLEAAIADADQPIGGIDVLSPAERRTILYDWNETAHAIPSTTLPELFAAQVAKSPRRDRGRVRGPAPHLQRARRALEPAGASSARTRRRSRGGGGTVRGALAGDARRPHRHPQGRRRLPAARPGLPARAPRLHAGGCARAAAADAVCVARSSALARCPRRAPRCRLADHCGAADNCPGQRPSAAAPRLCHLHVRLDRVAQGRCRYPPECRAAVRRDRTHIPLWRRRRLDPVPFVRLRLLGLGDLGRALAGRPLGRGSPFGQPLTAGILAPRCARRRNRPQSDAVCVLSIDADGPGESRPRTNAGATLCDLRR